MTTMQRDILLSKADGWLDKAEYLYKRDSVTSPNHLARASACAQIAQAYATLALVVGQA